MDEETLRKMNEVFQEGADQILNGDENAPSEATLAKMFDSLSNYDKIASEAEDKKERRRIDEEKTEKTLEAEAKKERSWRRLLVDMSKIILPSVIGGAVLFHYQNKEIDAARDPESGIRTSNSSKSLGNLASKFFRN